MVQFYFRFTLLYKLYNALFRVAVRNHFLAMNIFIEKKNNYRNLKVVDTHYNKNSSLMLD